ncbi:MAG: hypothetical protein ACQEV7_09710 [Bacillota bacterium]
MFVPFITKRGQYSTGIWMWLEGRWENVSVSTSPTPESWTSENGNTTYLTWNIHLGDQVEYIQFYLLSQRNFHVMQHSEMDSVETYQPSIQMSHRVIGFQELWCYSNPERVEPHHQFI